MSAPRALMPEVTATWAAMPLWRRACESPEVFYREYVGLEAWQARALSEITHRLVEREMIHRRRRR